jgi:hypothetical protein
MWHHPKYYEEMRKKRMELEASLKQQAASTKQEGDKNEQQASSIKRQAPEQKGHEDS